jgi:ArsR family transcriptional regulator, arsenate/arsenite/antimonite-responsive transcriptional repressor
MPSPDLLRVFKSLSDRTRLRIIGLLLEGDLCVCELMFILGMAQSRISHQLRILKDAGLVDDQRDGQWIIYHIPPRQRARITPLLEAFPRRTGESAGLEAADLKKLKICRKEGIRKKKCSAVIRPAGNA